MNTSASGSTPPLIHERVIAAASRNRQKLALADPRRTVNYDQLAGEILQRAMALRLAGVQPGDRVILAAVNSIDQLVTHFSILSAGGVSVPLAGDVTSERLAFLARDCAARTICIDDAIERVGEARPASQRTIITLSQLARRAAEHAPEMVKAERTADDIACLMYTTGSTGDPKAVVLTHRSLGSALSHIIEYLGCSENDREAVVLPLSHSFGLGHAYCTLSCGGFLWLNDGLRPLKAVFDAMSKYGINAMPTTPSMLRLLLGPYRVPFLRSAAGLRRMVVNSERLPPEQAAEVLAALPDADVVVYYGLTEASRSTFLRLREEPAARHATVGKAAPRVEIDIADAAGGTLPTGMEGEVRIRGPHLAAGYWQRPEEQAAAFRDGWLHSGDLGVLDADGYLTLTGRLKDQINVGGLKVSAAEIEAALRAHPSIADVAATGIPDPQGLRGEAIAVAVVARDARLTPESVAQFCAEHLEPAAQPHRIALVAAIPRAETGKVLKSEVRQILLSDGVWARA